MEYGITSSPVLFMSYIISPWLPFLPFPPFPQHLLNVCPRLPDHHRRRRPHPDPHPARAAHNIPAGSPGKGLSLTHLLVVSHVELPFSPSFSSMPSRRSRHHPPRRRPEPPRSPSRTGTAPRLYHSPAPSPTLRSCPPRPPHLSLASPRPAHLLVDSPSSRCSKIEKRSCIPRGSF